MPHARLQHPNEWGWKEGENGILYMYVHWTDNNQIAYVCHALKNVAAKMNAVADAHVNVPDSHVGLHHYAHARVNLVLMYCSFMSDIVVAIQYVQMLLQ